MSLAPGVRLGPYEILSPLGAGGMGEVYRAKDTRLDRLVAVKVLPSHLSASPESRQRFEREAKTISQLSHPHICALYDVGREGETEYLVMELLEGETLSDRLAKGRLPLEQTLRYGTEIADALDKAHRQEIVHRDLKPGNVMLTKSGVKLLDFGLAKVLDPAGPGESLTSVPTAAKDITREGAILGTLSYMSPEMTPPMLEHIVQRCLAKGPDDRWQSASMCRESCAGLRARPRLGGRPFPSGRGTAVSSRSRRFCSSLGSWPSLRCPVSGPAYPTRRPSGF